MVLSSSRLARRKLASGGCRGDLDSTLRRGEQTVDAGNSYAHSQILIFRKEKVLGLVLVSISDVLPGLLFAMQCSPARQFRDTFPRAIELHE